MYFIIFRITRFDYLYILQLKIFFYFLEIDIERCVRDSIEIFVATPRSCTYREHASDISTFQINNDLV